MNPQHHHQVTFSETSEMVLVTNLAEGHDKHKIWFTQDELDSFKSNMSNYIIMVRLHISKCHAPSASNILGLEKFLTVQLTEEYKFRRGKLAKEIINSQSMPSLLANDMERLARISAENSKWARERARAAALFLEQDQESERKQDLQAPSSQDSESPVHRRSRRRASLQETKRARATSAPISCEPISLDGASQISFIRTVRVHQSDRR